MINQIKIKNFDECIKFFGIPNLSYSQLSGSEQILFGVCNKFFRLGKLDFDDIDYDILDIQNRSKLEKLILELLGSF
ncbi:hypothetical protein ARV3_gp03 [Acidianus rod-shaped virus 3]|uniref:Uncharacterized protein n=1 Tax=Acidianus rod-shaped virus 3 TaxID=2730617 RepID=A0A6M3VXR3_9VIRU|nr:hypothetical protein QIT28_gp03 [Acidianus rod-shaped virus 3]QJF12316.1 hypothetical protein ARV3_gp03 [Acidianus rod-shaped virus 3]